MAEDFKINALMAQNIRLRVLLKECSDDLADELRGRYNGMLDHPAMKRRYDRDMESVIAARFALDADIPSAEDVLCVNRDITEGQ